MNNSPQRKFSLNHAHSSRKPILNEPFEDIGKLSERISVSRFVNSLVVYLMYLFAFHYENQRYSNLEVWKKSRRGCG